ncbi:MAG: putative negative regulator of flagellin synthesis (Anti-sigma-28 factor) FlgM-like [Herminiimonas sp.]|jgi:negative regulator of flagellin synthesis FlgM|nr:putative negative regulator of flagellin synthesis (Anti-sigma-28 factor) FlgM-like [Herminiimonas sp.]
MKIDDSSKKTPGVGVTAGQAGGSRAIEKAATSASSSDSVRISPQSQALASQVSGGDAVFDAAKVEEIKAAIANGSFKVNPERVADGLLDTVRDLIHPRKG